MSVTFTKFIQRTKQIAFEVSNKNTNNKQKAIEKRRRNEKAKKTKENKTKPTMVNVSKLRDCYYA